MRFKFSIPAVWSVHSSIIFSGAINVTVSCSKYFILAFPIIHVWAIKERASPKPAILQTTGCFANNCFSWLFTAVMGGIDKYIAWFEISVDNIVFM